MKGFHSNDKDRCEKFINDENYLIICETDTEYLGKGMYFWDNESQARWWKSTKNKEAIVKADIDLTNVLDMTNIDIVNEMGKLYKFVDKSIELKFQKQANRKVKKIDFNTAVGLKLDIIFEVFPYKMGKFDVIKGRREYKNKKESPFFYNTRLSTKSVDIYCVKVPEIVVQRELVA